MGADKARMPPTRMLALALLGATLTGCALPRVALGGRVSIASARASEAARSRVHSALWLALVYSARDADGERERPDARTPPERVLEESRTPCAIEVACAWEREAAYEALWARAAVAREGEESP